MGGSRDPEPALWTVKQVARVLAVSPRTVHRLVAEGKLAPALTLTRGAVRWDPDDVHDFLRRLRRGDFKDYKDGKVV